MQYCETPPAALAQRGRLKSSSQSTAEWREAMANAITLDEKYAVVRAIFEAAVYDKDMKAAALLIHQNLGKPAVTTAGKMADDAVSDEFEKRLALLPPEEFDAYVKITAKLQSPDALPAPGQEDKDG